MSAVFHRQLGAELPLAVSAQGATILDAQGRRYIDASGGAAVSCLGHNHPDVVDAIRAQLDRVDYAHTGTFSTPVAEALAARLVRDAPRGISHVWFTSGGSEAIETALKMARQHAVETGQPQRSRFVARRQSYHGNTLGALAVGGNAARRALYAPLLIDVEHVASPYDYRERAPGETPQAYGARLADELDATLHRIGSETVLAFVAETVGGATIGANTPPPGYLAAVRRVCDRHGVLLILDEVMCGMGRTGTLHACSQEDVVPDLLVVAKGLGAGAMPIGAVLVHEHVVDAFARGSGAFQHGFTYIGHPLACAAALAVQQVIERDGLLERVRSLGSRLAEQLADAFTDHPHVGDIRGRGLLQAIELVADRGARTPFDPDLKMHARVRRAAMERGLCVYPMGGTVDGRRGDHVLLAPPFIVDDETIDDIVARLAQSVRAATGA